MWVATLGERGRLKTPFALYDQIHMKNNGVFYLASVQTANLSACCLSMLAVAFFKNR